MKILIYDDSDIYGGQQAMGLRATASLLAHGETINFVYCKENSRLETGLTSLQLTYPNLVLTASTVRSKRLQAVRLFLEPRDVMTAIKILREQKPDLVLGVQGDIEIGSTMLLAARLLGVKIISYIPFAHTARTKGVKLAFIRDAIARILYKLPNGFITSGHAVAARLKMLSGRPVGVVRDCIKDVAVDTVKKEVALLRSGLGLPQDRYIAAIIARVVFKHKGQDFLVEVAKKYAKEIPDVVFLIVGDGPDESRLKELVQQSGVAHMFVFITWCDGIADVLDAIDLLLMPSVFEGMPLTMLEAMQRGRPILATRIDGMAEVLPDEMLYAAGNEQDFLMKLKRLSSAAQEDLQPLLDTNTMLQKDEFSISAFHSNYHAQLINLTSEIR